MANKNTTVLSILLLEILSLDTGPVTGFPTNFEAHQSAETINNYQYKDECY
jgi:hypothetical protein